MPKISGLPPIASPDGDDEMPIVDDSATTTKKFTLTQLKTWLQSLVEWITTAMITDEAVTPAKLEPVNDLHGASAGTFTAPKIQCGQVSADGSGALTTVTFPEAFSGTPRVVASSTYINPTAVNVEQISATSFKIEHGGSAAQTIQWIAVGPA